MSKRRLHHNAETGYSVYRDNSISSIAPYEAGSRDKINPDFRVPSEFPTPEFKPARRITGNCLESCVYTPISFFSAVTDIISVGSTIPFFNTNKIWSQELTYDVSLISYNFDSSSGACVPVLDGGGTYETLASCLSSNPTPPGQWNWFGSSQTYFDDKKEGEGPLGSLGRWIITSGVNSAEEVLNVQDIDYFIKTLGGQLETGGRNIREEGRGVSPGSNHVLQGSVETSGTTHPIDGFNINRFAWYRVNDGATLEDYQFFLSDYIAGVGGSGVGVGGSGPGAFEWTETSKGIINQIVTPVQWTETSTGSVKSYRAILDIYSDVDITDNSFSSLRMRVIFDDVINNGTSGRNINDGQCDLRIGVAVKRPTHEDVLERNRDSQIGVYLHDPHIGAVGLIPSDLFSSAFTAQTSSNVSNPGLGGQLIKNYYVPTKNQKIYIYSKYGKLWNPNITFNEREWARIMVTELDWSSGIPVSTYTIYSNPTLPPPIPQDEVSLNVIEEKTHSYVEQVISDPCVRGSSKLGWNIGGDSTLCYDSDELLDDGDPNTNRSRKFVFTEVGYQVNCKGEYIEYKSPGFNVSSSAQCNPRT